VLDVGTAFAPFYYRRLLTAMARSVDLRIIDLAPAEIAGAIFHRADIRSIPLPDATVDVALCVSTLEHIGMDNDRYGVQLKLEDKQPDVVALRELGRVTRPDGRIFVTVPAGAAREYAWFRQYSAQSWAAAVSQASLEVREISYFVHHGASGWTSATGSDLEGHDYGVDAPYAGALICAALGRR
jgi:SAM-dependent methyltransferase